MFLYHFDFVRKNKNLQRFLQFVPHIADPDSVGFRPFFEFSSTKNAVSQKIDFNSYGKQEINLIFKLYYYCVTTVSHGNS